MYWKTGKSFDQQRCRERVTYKPDGNGFGRQLNFSCKWCIHWNCQNCVFLDNYHRKTFFLNPTIRRAFSVIANKYQAELGYQWNGGNTVLIEMSKLDFLIDNPTDFLSGLASIIDGICKQYNRL